MRTHSLSTALSALARPAAMLAVAALAAFELAPVASAQNQGLVCTIDQAQEVPPTGSAATGTGYFVINRVANTLHYNIQFAGLSSAETQAHIHRGAVGVNGPILLALPLGSPKVGVWAYPESEELNIVTGVTYVNVHSATFPGGEVRGQILIDDSPTNMLEATSIDGGQEIPPVPTTATGSGVFTIDTVGNVLSFQVNYAGLSSAETQAHIHRGAVGVAGPILFAFALGASKSGFWVYPEAEEANLLGGLTYVNIHSATFPGGEIRGQITAVTNPTIYCKAKLNSQNCLPSMGFTGLPSASAGPDNFTVTCTSAINNKNGIFFWGVAPNNAPLQGGTLCVKAPFIRTSPVSSGGNPPPNDCSGTYSFLFSQAYMATNGLTAGETAYGEWWMRDPQHLDGTGVGFSNAIAFILLP